MRLEPTTGAEGTCAAQLLSQHTPWAQAVLPLSRQHCTPASAAALQPSAPLSGHECAAAGHGCARHPRRGRRLVQQGRWELPQGQTGRRAHPAWGPSCRQQQVQQVWWDRWLPLLSPMSPPRWPPQKLLPRSSCPKQLQLQLQRRPAWQQAAHPSPLHRPAACALGRRAPGRRHRQGRHRPPAAAVQLLRPGRLSGRPAGAVPQLRRDPEAGKQAAVHEQLQAGTASPMQHRAPGCGKHRLLGPLSLVKTLVRKLSRGASAQHPTFSSRR